VRMADQAPAAPPTSEAEEMYLITVARAVEDGTPEPVPASLIAKELGVSAVSTHQMVRKLAGRDLVDYTPYRGVSLTDAGSVIAAGILRRRRLWGVFFSRHLGLPAQRADTIACDMEHITPDDVANLLASYLDDPQVGPRGRHIPRSSGPSLVAAAASLSAVPVGDTVIVSSVEAPVPIDGFLADQGLLPGVAVTVLGIGGDGGRLVACGGGALQLAHEVVERVFIAGDE